MLKTKGITFIGALLLVGCSSAEQYTLNKHPILKELYMAFKIIVIANRKYEFDTTKLEPYRNKLVPIGELRNLPIEKDSDGIDVVISNIPAFQKTFSIPGKRCFFTGRIKFKKTGKNLSIAMRQDDVSVSCKSLS